MSVCDTAAVIKIAADLACGVYLPNLPDGKRAGHRQLRRAIDDAHEQHKLAAIKLREAVIQKQRSQP